MCSNTTVGWYSPKCVHAVGGDERVHVEVGGDDVAEWLFTSFHESCDVSRLGRHQLYLGTFQIRQWALDAW